jgi:glycosyltransferase involved in cell wall biosynthesis
MARFALDPPLRDLPLVFDMVDVDSLKWAALSGTARPPLRWIYAREANRLSRFEALAVRAAKTTLVVNERERVALESLVPDGDIRVLPVGVDVSAFRSPLPPADEPNVVFCGVMNYAPNEQAAVWLLTTVWPLVRARRPDARLSLVGSKPTNAIRKLAAADPTVHVTGHVADVRPYLWQSAVSVAPLSTARGVQFKVIEAVAAGLPTVVTRPVVEGLPTEILPACTTAEGPEMFATALADLLGKSAAQRRAIALRANVAALDWPARLSPLFDLFCEVLQDTPDVQATANILLAR